MLMVIQNKSHRKLNHQICLESIFCYRRITFWQFVPTQPQNSESHNIVWLSTVLTQCWMRCTVQTRILLLIGLPVTELLQQTRRGHLLEARSDNLLTSQSQCANCVSSGSRQFCGNTVGCKYSDVVKLFL